jgi:DNA adenine methylase
MSSVRSRAARFVYLNRHCLNGVYRTNRSGNFNVPRGRDTGTLPPLQVFKDSASALQRASLRAGDFESVLNGTRAGDFVYLDPPYSKADERYSGEYGYGAFSSTDFGRLLAQLERINELGATFLLSYRYSAQWSAANAIGRPEREWLKNGREVS